LEQLQKAERPEPEFIWRSLSPFLVDPSGNPHRSELNIEKLWNPYLPGRGCAGLVEFRAFRMTRSSQAAAAIAVLLRSLIVMLVHEDKVPGLIDQGALLHDRYALPFYLERDLERVFDDLRQSGFPIHDVLKGLLTEEPVRSIGQAEFQGLGLEIQQALEFWPLVGDVASQERGGSRLVDASTTRLQVSMRAANGSQTDLENFELWFDGYIIPLREEQDQHGPLKVTALRYRNFMPLIGLHPGIAARHFVTLILAHRGQNEALEITYHEWQPQGLPYSGLPRDLQDAEQRRAERVTTRTIPFDCAKQPKTIPRSAITEYCLDLRRLPG
ncbi:MAG: transglutaminase family protein, partial [Methylococcales bacterium]